MNVFFTPQSKNKKTGDIPTTISSKKTCPPSCPFMGAGCYADIGPLAFWWMKVSDNNAGISWDQLCNNIAALPEGTV